MLFFVFFANSCLFVFSKFVGDDLRISKCRCKTIPTSIKNDDTTHRNANDESAEMMPISIKFHQKSINNPSKNRDRQKDVPKSLKIEPPSAQGSPNRLWGFAGYNPWRTQGPLTAMKEDRFYSKIVNK